MRGIDTLTAVGLCAEIADFARFDPPKQLMSYVGLVPSEKSSGQTRRSPAIPISRRNWGSTNQPAGCWSSKSTETDRWTANCRFTT